MHAFEARGTIHIAGQVAQRTPLRFHFEMLWAPDPTSPPLFIMARGGQVRAGFRSRKSVTRR
jgi:hypothetical protein